MKLSLKTTDLIDSNLLTVRVGFSRLKDPARIHLLKVRVVGTLKCASATTVFFTSCEIPLVVNEKIDMESKRKALIAIPPGLPPSFKHQQVDVFYCVEADLFLGKDAVRPVRFSSRFTSHIFSNSVYNLERKRALDYTSVTLAQDGECLSSLLAEYTRQLFLSKMVGRTVQEKLQSIRPFVDGPEVAAKREELALVCRRRIYNDVSRLVFPNNLFKTVNHSINLLESNRLLAVFNFQDLLVPGPNFLSVHFETGTRVFRLAVMREFQTSEMFFPEVFVVYEKEAQVEGCRMWRHTVYVTSAMQPSIATNAFRLAYTVRLTLDNKEFLIPVSVCPFPAYGTSSFG